MAELHIIGQLQNGRGFGNTINSFVQTGLLCKWAIQAGSSWKKIVGAREGQTQVDTPSYSDISHWCHPIDIHFVTKGLHGWPKLILEVCRQDEFGRIDLAGYGVCHIPATPGSHLLEIPTWRPAGGLKNELTRYFLGGSTELSETDFIANSVERYRLKTVTSGTVTAELNIIHKNFDKFGVETI